MTSELIRALQESLYVDGDLECYTNGKYGSDNPVKMTQDMVSSGPADLQLGDEMETHKLTPDDNVLHIGGY